MQKTKLGISVGLFGALLYLCGLFGGYIITILLAAYALLMEENLWLKRTSAKVVALMVGFSVIYTLIGLIPDLMGIINSVCRIFGGSFSIAVISNIISFIQNVISLAETVIFLLLGLKAVKMTTIRIPVIDNLLNKHFN